MKTIALCVLGCVLSGPVFALNQSEPNVKAVVDQTQPPNAESALNIPSNSTESNVEKSSVDSLPNEAVSPYRGAIVEEPDGDTHTSPPLTPSGQPEPQTLSPIQTDVSIEQTTETEVNTPKEEPETRFWVLDWSQEFATGYVEKLNDGVDSFFMGAFFDDEVIEDESSGSNGRLYFTTRRVADQGVDYKVGLNLSLVLPKTRDRFKLLVETDDNEDGEQETDLLNTTDNVTYTTAIRVELNNGERWKNSLDNGVRWEGKPVYFTRLRNRRTDYFYNWRNRFLHSIYWRTDIAWGTKISTNLLHPITDTSHFSTGFNADYIVDNDYADLDADVAVFHQINRKSAMLYQLAIFGDTDRLTQVNNYVFSVSYRRKIYRQFVFAEIVPEVAWPREENFEATPALNFRLEMIFGTNYN